MGFEGILSGGSGNLRISLGGQRIAGGIERENEENLRV
jgi:hypothetical protein